MMAYVPTTTRRTTSRLESLPLVLSCLVALVVIVLAGVLLRQALVAITAPWDDGLTPTGTPTQVTP